MTQNDLLIDDEAKYSKACEEEYNAGDRSALMRIVVASAICKRRIPDWAASILDGAYGCAAWAKISSWDEVFGKPNPKNKAIVRKYMLRDKIYFRIFELSLEGRPIDDLLFEQVADEFKKESLGGKTKVKELYAQAKKRLGPIPRRNSSAGKKR